MLQSRAIRAIIPFMADLRVNDIGPLALQIRIAASVADKTIKEFVIDALKVAIAAQKKGK